MQSRDEDILRVVAHGRVHAARADEVIEKLAENRYRAIVGCRHAWLIKAVRAEGHTEELRVRERERHVGLTRGSESQTRRLTGVTGDGGNVSTHGFDEHVQPGGGDLT